jgi:hypothetical protein
MGVFMRKQIIYYIWEIILTILVVFISIPVWNDLLFSKDMLEKSMAMNGLELSKASDEDDEFKATTGYSLDGNTYYVKNNSDYNAGGTIYYKLAKVSLLKPEYLIINVNDYSTDLSNLYSSEDDNYYIYKIGVFNLNGGEVKEYKVSLNIKDEYLGVTSGKSYVYNIMIEPDNANI